ncbi:DUF523 domain-containing protein [Pseudomaricurvus sp.]|uniref:DUF523 domain-containing protein n=1 Tax=Pseudomaricurvus sp. TaxID=2004510 RepID=UPI003F6A5418
MNQDDAESHRYLTFFCHLKTLSVQPPRVLISACLAGENVRYDGKEKSLGKALPQLTEMVELVQHCPEMDAGMGVPRAPIQWLQTTTGEQQLQWVNRPGQTPEYPLQEKAEQWCRQHPDLDAAILKARSPSCGKGTTPLLNEQGDVVQFIDGLFVTQLKRSHRQLPIVDEAYFSQDSDLAWFVAGLYLQTATCEMSKTLRQPLQWSGDLMQFLTTPANQRADRLQTLTAQLRAG